ncbi:NUDIX hydrolase [Glycomyces amatae]|uniref:NUDIX hydrolase n=1 Tax=Glycomyces amatae TaxID=2881355 RepID=UPI0034E2EEED
MTFLVVDDAALMMPQHRFVIAWWVWELPGGSTEPGNDLAVCAARECVEGTGVASDGVDAAGVVSIVGGDRRRLQCLVRLVWSRTGQRTRGRRRRGHGCRLTRCPT